MNADAVKLGILAAAGLAIAWGVSRAIQGLQGGALPDLAGDAAAGAVRAVEGAFVGGVKELGALVGIPREADTACDEFSFNCTPAAAWSRVKRWWSDDTPVFTPQGDGLAGAADQYIAGGGGW